MPIENITKVERAAITLANDGFPFHAELLRDAAKNGTLASTAERVAIMLEKGKRWTHARMVRMAVHRMEVAN